MRVVRLSRRQLAEQMAKDCGRRRTEGGRSPQLVFDGNGNGRVDGADEFSFARFAGGARTDLEGLRAFDTDGDGLLSAGDEAYGDFLVWQDRNGNGHSEPGEMLIPKLDE